MVPSAPLPLWPWLAPLQADLALRFAGEDRDGAHDLSHALRVARNAWMLAQAEGADAETCVAAALLHDLVYRTKNHPESSRTALWSAEEARAWCAARPELASRAEAVAEAIRTHSFSAGLEPTTREGEVLQDADRLEALGAIGLARCFATGGAMGAGLWHPEDPWGEARPLDDKAWSLDHFPCKLLKLRETFRTAAGRREAARRHAVLETFLEALRQELSASAPDGPGAFPSGRGSR